MNKLATQTRLAGRCARDKMENVKRKVGRPGRKKLDVQSKNKRTQQNRAAQRAYRERKEAKLNSLENRIHILEKLNSQREQESNFLQEQLSILLQVKSEGETGAKNVSNDHIDKFLLRSKQVKEKLTKDLLQEGEHLDELMTTLSSGPNGIHHISKLNNAETDSANDKTKSNESSNIDNEDKEMKNMENHSVQKAEGKNNNSLSSNNDTINHNHDDSYNNYDLKSTRRDILNNGISLFLQTPKNDILLHNNLPDSSESPYSIGNINSTNTDNNDNNNGNNYNRNQSFHFDSSSYDDEKSFWSHFKSKQSYINNKQFDNIDQINPFTNNWDNNILNNYIIDENDIGLMDPSLVTTEKLNYTDNIDANTCDDNNNKNTIDKLAFPDIWNDNLLNYLQLADIDSNAKANKLYKNKRNGKVKCDLLTEHVINKKSLQSLMQDRQFIDSHSHAHSSTNDTNTHTNEYNDKNIDGTINENSNDDSTSNCSSCDSCCCGDVITELAKTARDPLEVALKSLCDRLLVGSELDAGKNVIMVDPRVI